MREFVAKKTSAAIGAATRERWALVKRASLTITGGSPSKADVASAKRILARKRKRA